MTLWWLASRRWRFVSYAFGGPTWFFEDERQRFTDEWGTWCVHMPLLGWNPFGAGRRHRKVR